jgi:hypothetical protein
MNTKGTTAKPKPETEPELGRLIEDAANASPGLRIEFRDRIAAYGADAVVAMEAWTEQGRSPGFAIAVLEAVGKAADDAGAASALRRIASRVPDWADVAQQALARLGPSGRAAAAGQAPQQPRPHRPIPGDVSMATGTPPPVEGPCIIPNRDGSACRNRGRHPVEGGWSCTPHMKAATRQASSA